jgi:hypothetical protein
MKAVHLKHENSKQFISDCWSKLYTSEKDCKWMADTTLETVERF